jgi:hypothetical protein
MRHVTSLNYQTGDFDSSVIEFERQANEFGRHDSEFARQAIEFGRQAIEFMRHENEFGRHDRGLNRCLGHELSWNCKKTSRCAELHTKPQEWFVYNNELKSIIMKTESSNRVNMINANITYCDANTTATSGITSFATVLGNVKSKMVLINSLNQIGDGTTTGVTLDTKLLRKAMTGLALKCGNATLAYANSVHNNTLAALVNYTESKLNSLKKEDVDDTCEAIHDATNDNIAAVTPFGATATDVTDLQAAIALYRTASQNPRQAIISRSQAKLQADNMIREVIDDLLAGQLDKMAGTLKLSNPEFYSGYKQSREIIDLGTTTAKIRGTVLDVNDTPLRNVEFTIYKTGTGEVVAETRTDIKGKYGISKLPVGIVDLKWVLSGYKTVTEREVKITAGKELRRKIVMEEAIVREGEFLPGKIENVDLNGVDEAITKITVEAIGTSVQVFGSNGPGNGPNGNTLFVDEGQAISKSRNDFINVTSFMLNGNTFLNVQNMGSNLGEWRITFEK